MATQVWSGGANDGVFLTAGNWVSGVAPGNGDTAIVGATNQNILGAATGLTTVTLIVTNGFGGSIGSDGVSLTFASATLITYAGRGAVCNIGCAGTVAAASFEHYGTGLVNITSGTWTLLTNSYGPMTVSASAVVTTLNNIGGNITIGYNATAITTLTSGGSVRCARVCTTANVLGSKFTSIDNGTTTYITNGTVNVYNGAEYNKQSGGTDTAINAFPGSTFSILGTSGGAAGVVTVTTLSIWSSAKIIDAAPGLVSGQVTYTNPKVYRGAITPTLSFPG